MHNMMSRAIAPATAAAAAAAAATTAAAVAFALTLGVIHAQAQPPPPANPDEPSDATVERIHRAALTIDPHIDIRNDFNTPGREASGETADQLDLPKLERGGLDVATVALFADPARRTPENVAAARKQIDTKLAALRRFVEANPNRLEFANTAASPPKVKLDAATYAKYQPNYREYSSSGWKQASLVDWLDSVDYAVRLIGIDHVGLSSDFNHGGGVIGYAHVGEAQNVTRELLKRGYSEEDIRKLWGGNFLRVFRDVEASAKTIQRDQPATTTAAQR
jgi:microsomal dipeptidase-like Zn-dependent dipeptidase